MRTLREQWDAICRGAGRMEGRRVARSERRIFLTSMRTSRKLAMVDAYAYRMYVQFHLAADSYQTLQGDPWDLHLECCGGFEGGSFTESERALGRLVDVGLLERWEVDGKTWWYAVGSDDAHTEAFKKRRGKRRSPVPPSILGSHDSTPVSHDSTAFSHDSTPVSQHSTDQGLRSKVEESDDKGNPTSPRDNHAAAPFTEDVARANIRKAKRTLSTLADAAEEYAGIVFTAKPVSLTRTESARYEQIFRPLAQLVTEHGDAIVRPALAAAIAKRITGNPALWLTLYCENAHADEILTGKPKPAEHQTVASILAGYGLQVVDDEPVAS